MELHRARHAVIVVGVDGSPQGQEALRFAVAEARRTGDQVEVLTAWPGAEPGQSAEGAESLAAERQDHAVESAVGSRGAVTMTRSLEHGDPGVLLTRAARHARMLVLGGQGPAGAIRLGAVGRYCAEHAGCPVVIVPGPQAAAQISPGPPLPRAMSV